MKSKYVGIRKYDSDKGKFVVVANKIMTEYQLIKETSKPTVCDVFIRGKRPAVGFNNHIRPDVIVYHK